MASAPKERGEKRGAPGRAAPEREGGRLYDVLAIAGNRRAARAERERERESREWFKAAQPRQKRA